MHPKDYAPNLTSQTTEDKLEDLGIRSYLIMRGKKKMRTL